MGCCEFCIYAETDSQNEWNQQASDESDNDDNEDVSDTDDECRHESIDEE